MAKMFYSAEEAAEKLNVSVDEVREMASSGRLQEFRDGDKLVFKVEQVDLLAAGAESDDDDDDLLTLDESALSDSGGGSGVGSFASDDDEGVISLDDLGAGSSGSAIALEPDEASTSGTGSAISLEGSGIGGSGVPLESGDSGADSGQRSGVSIFDADELEQADPAAMTQIVDEGMGEVQLDSVGSGSGLMDLTRESDDTSLGMDDLLDDFAGEEDSPTETVAEGDEGLFEAAEEESPLGVPAGAMGGAVVAAEPYDGSGSGLAGGMAVGMIAATALAVAVVITAMVGMPDAGLAGLVADQFMIVIGVLAGIPVFFGLVGFLLGRRSS